MTQTGPPAQALAAKALPLAAIDTAAMPASTARHERLVRRLRILAPPGLACTGTPREMLAQLSGGDSALQRRRRPRRRADAAHRHRAVCRRYPEGCFGVVHARRSRCSSSSPASLGGPATRPSRSLARTLMQQRRVADIRQALVAIGLRLVGVRIERTDRQVNERADRPLTGAAMQDALAPSLGKAWIGPRGLAGAVLVDDAVLGDELRTHAFRLAGRR